MTAEAPTCTVAIPVYNQKEFVERAVRSALAQDLPALEVLVVDNASTDGTWEAVQKFRADSVKLERNPTNLGLFGNFNRCMELAASPYLRFLSSDDALPARCLGREIALMERHPDVVMVSTRGEFRNASGTVIGSIAADFPPGVYEGRAFSSAWLQYYLHYRRNPLNYPSGVLLRRSAIGRDLRFDEALATGGDIDFFLRLLERGNLAIDDALGAYITRHVSQAHVRPNMDGTAMREMLTLLERRAGRSAPKLRDQFAGMCIAVALLRWPIAATRDSARIHLELARTVRSGWGAAAAGLARLVGCRAARMVLRHRAPYVPKPLHAL